MHWRRQWQPTPVFLPGESQGRGEPGGLPSVGSHRVGHDCDLAAAEIYTGMYTELFGESHGTELTAGISELKLNVSFFKSI